MSVSEATSEAANSNNSLILDSLEIKNFRAFRHLTIEKLGRVNLITGKNNVGKSSLLEALWLYAERGSPWTVRRILETRGELSSISKDSIISQDLTAEDLTLSFLPLFHQGLYDTEPAPLEIGRVNDYDLRLSLFLAWLADAKIEGHNGLISYTPVRREEAALYNATLYLMAEYGHKMISRSKVDKIFQSPAGIAATLNKTPSLLISSAGIAPHLLEDLYDFAILNRLEGDILAAVKKITPGIEGLTFLGEQRIFHKRSMYARVDSVSDLVPIKRLGDGINRMVGLALAIVNSRNGYVLLDEIENGIHYSVLPDVWRFIFQTARRLNVQVFATTHSWDCIEAFQQAAAEDDDPNSGVLVRLQNDDGDVSATVFDERRLAVVTRQGIEVR